MKLPKRVKICGKTWNIRYDGSSASGSFDGGNMTITIGNLSPQATMEILLHEVIESLLTELKYRYKVFDDAESEDILFSMTHRDFTNFIIHLTDIFNQLRGDK